MDSSPPSEPSTNSVDPQLAAAAEFHEKLSRLPVAGSAFTSVTNLIVGANVIVFVVMAGFLGAGWIDANTAPYVRFGANNAAATTDGEWWRLGTSMFMHYGIIHLLLNMWALFQFGHFMERLQGRGLFALTYLMSGIGGSLLSLWWNGDEVWSAGASGAVFGIYGALLGHMLREKQAIPRSVFQPMLKSTLTFAGYNLVYGLVHPGIDNAAHIGGFLTGAILGWLTAMPVDPMLRAKLVRRKAAVAFCGAVAIVALGVSAAPRFDYSVHEELAWQDAVKEFADNEPALLKQMVSELGRWRKGESDGATLAALIDNQLEPLYKTFIARLDELPLSPGRVTDERRNVLREFSRLRLESYQHLRSALRGNEQAEFAAYEKLDAQAGAVIRSYKERKKD